MPDPDLVSCIIIFLNAAGFIEEAIGSVFAQSYKQWELLLVDDGSTDESTSIARQYADQFPGRVRYLEHEDHSNRGMSAARNLGIQNARGQYIAFLDADDVWLPLKLEQQLAILNANREAAMVYGRTQIWCSWTGRAEDVRRDHFLELGVGPDRLVMPPTLFFLLLRNRVQTPTTCNVMMRREVFERVGTFEESFPGLYEDQAFFLKVHVHLPVFVASAWWARYRQHPESHLSVAETREDYYVARLPFLRWVERYLTQQGISEASPLWQAVQRELWLHRHAHLYRLLHYFQDASRTVRARLLPSR